MLDHVALVDIDGFIGKNAERLSRARVADICSSLRVFLRFLRTTGRLRADLASGVDGVFHAMAERVAPQLKHGRPVIAKNVQCGHGRPAANQPAAKTNPTSVTESHTSS